MSVLNRSGLDSMRASMGFGQGNIRNSNTRSNDMYKNPYFDSQQQPFPGMQNWQQPSMMNSNSPYGQQQQQQMGPPRPNWNQMGPHGNPGWGMQAQQPMLSNGPQQNMAQPELSRYAGGQGWDWRSIVRQQQQMRNNPNQPVGGSYNDVTMTKPAFPIGTDPPEWGGTIRQYDGKLPNYVKPRFGGGI